MCNNKEQEETQRYNRFGLFRSALLFCHKSQIFQVGVVAPIGGAAMGLQNPFAVIPDVTQPVIAH
jgi:hypothetical protein